MARPRGITPQKTKIGELRLTSTSALSTRQERGEYKFNLLRQLDFFTDFGDVELWEVLRLSRWSKLPAMTEILTEGDGGDDFFILAAGQVEVLKGKKLLGVLGQGACFGEMAYLSRPATPRSATVRAKEEVTLIGIQARKLDQSSDNCQLAFNRAFLRIMSFRVAHINALFAREYSS